MTEAVLVAEDRSMEIPAGAIVRTDYVAVDNVPSPAVPAWQSAMWTRHIGSGCNLGYWEGKRFVLLDSRHEYIASLMLGHSHLLVAWAE